MLTLGHLHRLDQQSENRGATNGLASQGLVR